MDPYTAIDSLREFEQGALIRGARNFVAARGLSHSGTGATLARYNAVSGKTRVYKTLCALWLHLQVQGFSS